MRPTPKWRSPARAMSIQGAARARASGSSSSDRIHASDPADKDMLFEPAISKIYRHPSFYDLPDDVENM